MWKFQAATEADKVVTVANEPLQSSLMVLLFCIEKSRLYLTATVGECVSVLTQLSDYQPVVVLCQCFNTVERLPASSCAVSVF